MLGGLPKRDSSFKGNTYICGVKCKSTESVLADIVTCAFPNCKRGATCEGSTKGKVQSAAGGSEEAKLRRAGVDSTGSSGEGHYEFMKLHV